MPQTALPATSQRYEVRLDVFNGPLDLLLQLIERRQLDITLVSLAAVTDQYIEYVQALPEPDPDQLADFLVVAAKLLAIKALALVARPPEQPSVAEDDGEELLRALREYQRFKRVAEQLRAWDGEQRRIFARTVPAAPIRLPAPDGLRLDDLIGALRRRLAVVPPLQPDQSVPEAPEYSIQDKIALIEAVLADDGSACFHQLLPPYAPALEVITTFLALLELLKRRRISAEQTSTFGEIVIRPYRVDQAPE